MTVAVILFITYIEGMRVEVPITSVKYRGFQGVYPIKLLYVSNIPVILVSALTANVSFFTRILSNYVGTGPPSWMHYLVTYDTNNNPTGGLVYYITPPSGIEATAADPVQAVIYTHLPDDPRRDVREDLGGDRRALFPDRRQEPHERRRAGARVQEGWASRIEQVLNRYIPPITVIGGLIIGSVAAISDVFGVFGTGVGLLLGVDIVLQYYQMLVKEQLEEFSPRLAGVLGQT